MIWKLGIALLLLSIWIDSVLGRRQWERHMGDIDRQFEQLCKEIDEQNK